MTTEIFVFGSNLAGRHGKGAALAARNKYGAEYGVGFGLTGRAYAIPTKGNRLEILTLDEIRYYVDRFKDFARLRHDLLFRITAIGCGLAGYTPDQIGPLFKGVSANCILPKEFEPYV